MQRQRPANLVQIGGTLIAAALLVYLLTFVTGFLVHIAGIAFIIGLILLIVGLVLPGRRI
jgi:hypothetical protein